MMVQYTWPASWAGIHITVKELLPIMMACAMWGGQWSIMSVKCLCDNSAVMAILNSGTSKNTLAMHLMRCLTFFWAYYNLFLFAEHIPGKQRTWQLIAYHGINFLCSSRCVRLRLTIRQESQRKPWCWFAPTGQPQLDSANLEGLVSFYF